MVKVTKLSPFMENEGETTVQQKIFERKNMPAFLDLKITENEITEIKYIGIYF